jgi:predicted DNA-binding protein (UPF0278 family)
MAGRFRLRVSIVEESGPHGEFARFDRERELHMERIEDLSTVLQVRDPEAFALHIAKDIAIQLASEFERRRGDG